MKVVFFLFFAILLSARENPFLPAGDLNTNTLTTNVKQTYPDFKTLEIRTNANDMLLREIVLLFRADDGNENKKKISIDQLIKPNSSYLLISKDEFDKSIKAAINEATSKLESELKSIKNARQDQQDASKQDVSNKPEKTALKQNTQVFKFKNLVGFELFDESIKIYTKAKNIKHFTYENKKIVLDFNASFNQFATFVKNIKHEKISKISIGAHNGYFRVVLNTLNTKYTIKSIKGGYELNF